MSLTDMRPIVASKLIAAVTGSILLCTLALAQTAPSLGVQSAPCQPTPEQERRTGDMQRKLNDWPNLARYHDANAKLAPPAPTEDRVVFMGDSITDNWAVVGASWLPNMKPFFPGKPYINRGISGQTTPQMLVRFRPDVIDLKPKVVVLLAGINDIAGNTGEIPLASTEENIASMTELARAAGIRVVLASVLPASNLPWRPSVTDVVQRVTALNLWIRDYAARNGLVYLDYYSAMNDGNGGLKPELAHDAVHPNAAGYDVMAPLAEAAIQKALKELAPPLARATTR